MTQMSRKPPSTIKGNSAHIAEVISHLEDIRQRPDSPNDFFGQDLTTLASALSKEETARIVWKSLPRDYKSVWNLLCFVCGDVCHARSEIERLPKKEEDEALHRIVRLATDLRRAVNSGPLRYWASRIRLDSLVSLLDATIEEAKDSLDARPLRMVTRVRGRDSSSKESAFKASLVMNVHLSVALNFSLQSPAVIAALVNATGTVPPNLSLDGAEVRKILSRAPAYLRNPRVIETIQLGNTPDTP